MLNNFVRRAPAAAVVLLWSTLAAAQAQSESANAGAVVSAFESQGHVMERLATAHDRAGSAVRAVLGSDTDRMNPDELEAHIADRVPGFAGWVHRTDGSSVMRMVPQGEAAFAAAAVSLAAATQSQLDGRPAMWDSRQLLDYKRKAFLHGASAGLVSVHIDRDANRVAVHYNDQLNAAAIEALENRLVASGVPRSALVLTPTQSFTGLSKVGTSVQAQPLPLGAGSRVRYMIAEGEFVCTLGLPVERNGMLGFVTAAHCSQQPYSLSGTPMSSPAGEYIGFETYDPAPFNCALNDNLGCRNADVLFTAGGPPNAVDFGKLLETKPNSLKVSAVRKVVGSVNYPAIGSAVKKTGQTTGTRSSKVVATCVDALVSTPQNSSQLYGVLCATVVDKVSGGLSFADAGDSGSPIWVDSGSGAKIAGLLSYGNDNYVGFSPWGQVVKDMGPLKIR